MSVEGRAPGEAIDVVAAVIERSGEYLICQRPAHKRHGGLWEFPGGKVETGETIETAVRRELREEIGVEVISVGEIVLSRQDLDSPFIIHFVTVIIRGAPVALEHDQLAWISPGEAVALPLAPSDSAFVEHLLRKSRT